MKKYVMALDQGTTSSRAILFDKKGNICAKAQHEFTQIYPKAGWVEHNPMEILFSQLQSVMEVMAKSGAECLRILERKHVDLIFMDQMMPGMDGTQVLFEIRKMERRQNADKPVPVVLLTADDTVGARKHYLEAGFNDYIPKPVEPGQIREQVEHYLLVSYENN